MTSALRAPAVLCIGATDPTGGAGLARDLTTVAAAGAWGACAVTAITVQTAQGLQRLEPLDPVLVQEQIRAAATTRLSAIKIGVLPTVHIVEAVASVLGDLGLPVVLDPVGAASAGGSLAADGVPDAVVALLFPLVTLVTPNVSEATALTGLSIGDRDEQVRAAEGVRARGAGAVLLTGGHMNGPVASDVLVGGDGVRWFESPRREVGPTHGTGCALAAGIAAGLAQGFALADAIDKAKRWVERNLDSPLGLEWRS